jgi:hypothetical protein
MKLMQLIDLDAPFAHPEMNRRQKTPQTMQ